MTGTKKGVARSKKRAVESESDDEIITKKVKATASGLPKKSTDDEGRPYWELSAKNRVTVQDYNGKTFVNIREWYEKDGKKLPGKKGIMLPPEQFATLIAALPQMEIVLSKSGVDIPRPQYDGAPLKSSASEEDLDESEDDEEAPKPSQKNKQQASKDDDDEDDD